jgi:hypothetical protein
MDEETAQGAPLGCTVGHSTHTLEEFTELLKRNSVTHILDVRTVPRSRRNPQFNKDALPASLALAGVAYTHLPKLGGLRRTPQANRLGLAWYSQAETALAAPAVWSPASENRSDATRRLSSMTTRACFAVMLNR